MKLEFECHECDAEYIIDYNQDRCRLKNKMYCPFCGGEMTKTKIECSIQSIDKVVKIPDDVMKTINACIEWSKENES